MSAAAFLFIVLSLAAFRMQRVVTADEWPPSAWLRDKVEERTGSDSSWFTLVTCPWCFGFWVAAAVFLEQHYVQAVPFVVYAIFAGSAVVGLLAEWSSE